MLQFDGTLVVIAISFIIFMLIMQNIFYTPLQKIMEDRKNFLDENQNDAQSAKEDAMGIFEEYENHLKEAKKLGNDLISKSLEEANTQKAQLVSQVSENCNNKITQSKNELNEEKEQAKSQMKEDVIKLANLISHKVLKKEIPMSGINDEVIDRVLKG